jgi:hypothetical protein
MLVPACCRRYLHWVGCPNELPPTMSAYKTQQYRWNSGPMVVIKQLVRAHNTKVLAVAYVCALRAAAAAWLQAHTCTHAFCVTL